MVELMTKTPMETLLLQYSIKTCAEVDHEVWNRDIMDLDLSHSLVACVLTDSTFPTGAHVLESQDI
jgi:hypothetical protein